MRTRLLVWVIWLLCLATASGAEDDPRLPTRYPDIIARFNADGTTVEARADLLLHVLRQMNAGNLPDDASRTRLVEAATQTIDAINGDSALLKERDRPSILRQLRVVRRALGGAPHPAAGGAGAAVASPKARRLDPASDRAAAVATVAKLAGDLTAGPPVCS